MNGRLREGRGVGEGKGGREWRGHITDFDTHAEKKEKKKKLRFNNPNSHS